MKNMTLTPPRAAGTSRTQHAPVSVWQTKENRLKTGLQTRMLIHGRWMESTSGKTFPTINPATGDTIAMVAEGDKPDVDLAVTAARRAFEAGPWRRMHPRDRGHLLYKLADLVESNLEELAALETLDNGKPIHDSRTIDLPLVIDCYR